MLPSVAVFAMGGTIAMAGRGERGVTPSLDAAALVEAVPQLGEVASIEAQTFRLLPSPEVTLGDLFALADAIEQAVAGRRPRGGGDSRHRHDGGVGLRAGPHPRPRCPCGRDRSHAQPDARRPGRTGQPAQRRAPRSSRAGARSRRHGRHERRDPRRALRAEGGDVEPRGLPLEPAGAARLVRGRRGAARRPAPALATRSAWPATPRSRRSRC